MPLWARFWVGDHAAASSRTAVLSASIDIPSPSILTLIRSLSPVFVPVGGLFACVTSAHIGQPGSIH